MPEQSAIADFRVDIEFDTARALNRWRHLEDHACTTAFQTHAFISVWIEQYGEANVMEPFFVFIAKDEMDIAAIPLVLIRQRYLKTIKFLGVRESDYSTLMVDNTSGQLPELSSLWPFILEKLPICDLLWINKIPQTPLLPGFDLASLPGLKQSSSSAHPLQLTPGAEEPVRPAMRARVLADLKRRRRRLEEQGKLQFNVYQTASEATAAFEEMAALRISRFEAIGRRDGLRNQKQYSFFRTLCQRFPRFASVTSLTLDDQPIALQYGLLGPNRYYQLITAFSDGPWRVNAPGRLLMLETLRWCAGQGIEVYDFTIGNETYKKAFGTRELPLMELKLARSWKGRAYLAGKNCELAIGRLARTSTKP